MFGGISGNGKRGREIWEVKDWLGGEHSFQRCKGVVTGLVPGLGVSLFGEDKEGAGGIGVVGNEMLIEVCKPKERPYIPDS